MTRIDASLEPWYRPAPDPRDGAMLAHDIRGALNGVMGGIEMIDRSRIDDDVLLQVERISAAAESLASLIAEAMGEGAAAAGTLTDEVEVKLPAFLRSVERRWSGEAREKGLHFVIEAGPGLPDRLLVPAIVLARVVANLVGNAVKFSGAGIIRLTVSRQKDGGVAFVLQDQGPGLGGGSPRRVFEYGFRQPGVAQPGQGIGLHIAKSLTEALGGRLTLADRPEGGLEAVLGLPEHLCRDDEPERRPEGAPDLGGLRVLLAEDNPTNQMVASQMLASLNAVVTVASDGVEALGRFEAAEYDLVIVDIEMPRKSGLDVIRAIRARTDARAQTPIVALTAYAMKEHRLQIADAGADGLISKPIVSTEAFGRAISQHVRPRPPAGAGPGAADGDTPEIDEEAFHTLAGAVGGEMMAELLDRIVADLEAAGSALAAAREPLDVAAIRNSSHILISVAGAFGAVRLQRRASELNSASNDHSDAELAARLTACLDQIAPAIAFARGERARC